MAQSERLLGPSQDPCPGRANPAVKPSDAAHRRELQAGGVVGVEVGDALALAAGAGAGAGCASAGRGSARSLRVATDKSGGLGTVAAASARGARARRWGQRSHYAPVGLRRRPAAVGGAPVAARPPRATFVLTELAEPFTILAADQRPEEEQNRRVGRGWERTVDGRTGIRKSLLSWWLMGWCWFACW